MTENTDSLLLIPPAVKGNIAGKEEIHPVSDTRHEEEIGDILLVLGAILTCLEIGGLLYE